MQSVFSPILLVVASLAVSIQGEVAVAVAGAVPPKAGVCNPVQSCASSTECALSGDSLSCRCSYLRCKEFGSETCGGGCLTDRQCAQWAGEDPSCVCTWWLECERPLNTDSPGYALYAKMMMGIKKEKIQQRLAFLTKEMKKMENEMDERFRAL